MPGTPFLLVEPRGGNFAQDEERVELLLDFGLARRAPGRVTIYAPQGFAIGADALAGAPLGAAVIDTVSSSGRGARLRGSIAVLPFDPGVAEAGRLCSGTEPTGAWVLRLARSGRRVEVPVYLARSLAPDSAGTEYRLDLCLGALAPPQGGPTPSVWAIRLSLTDVRQPAAQGSYLWRAIVTPLAGDQRSLRPGAAYELRGRVPIPHRLTLRGDYVAKARVALLRGTLRARGNGRPGIDIAIVKLDRAVTETGFIVRDAAVAIVRSTNSGSYVVRVPVSRTTGFLAYAIPVESGCASSDIAPAGCLSATTAGVESDPVTVGVP